MCHGWSDPHYFTFDGAEIHYMGVGEYMLSERSPECEDLRDFQLLVEQEHRYGGTSVSYVKSITLTLPDTVKLKIGRHRKQTVVSHCVFFAWAYPITDSSCYSNSSTGV